MDHLTPTEYIGTNLTLNRFSKLPDGAKQCLIYAGVRWLKFGPTGHGNVSGGLSLTTAWLGLGKYRYYRDAIEYNLMAPVNNQLLPRDNEEAWFKLTPTGVEYVTELIKDKYIIDYVNSGQSPEFELWPDF